MLFRSQFQARVASHREARARSLYELSRELSSALETDQVIQIAEAAISRQFRARSLVLVARDEAPLRLPPADAPIAGLDAGTAQWALDHAQPAGLGTDTLPGSAFLYLPLKASMRNRGVLAVQPGSRRLLLIPEQRRQLETFAALVAIALERVHYVEVAQQATLRIESERLRNSLLSALSHDLRTPLAALYGLADTLALYRQLPPAQADIVDAIRAETQRMNALVNNLLDMARIQSGEIRLNLQWQPFEEVVGSALAAMRSALGRHTVRTELARDAPLLNFDAVLIERVLCNLLENAAKYTPPGSEIVIASQVRAADLLVSVSDNGPGLPRGQTESVFDKFTRGERESAKPGVGLGLAICRAIIEEHKGRIWADPEPAAGARFLFTLPLGVPPQMPAVEEPQDGARVTP